MTDPPVKLNGNLIANAVTADNAVIIGNEASPKSAAIPFVAVEGAIKTETVDVKATTTMASTLEATKAITIKSISQIQGSSELKIEGKLSVHGKFVQSEEAASTFFLEELVVNEASQYASVEHLGGKLPSGAYHDGWKWSDGTQPNSELYEISDPYYLEACPGAAAIKTPLEVSREFFAPDMFGSYEISTNFHFLNGDWNGRVGYLKVNDEIVWMESYTSQSTTLALARDRFSVPIKVIFKANGPTFKISFGSNLQTGTTSEDVLGAVASATFCMGPAWSSNDVTISLRTSSENQMPSLE